MTNLTLICFKKTFFPRRHVLTPCLPQSVGNHRAARATSLETEISDYAIVYLCYKRIDVYSKPKLVVVGHLVPKL